MRRRFGIIHGVVFCGIGGGVIIKPMLDSFDIYSVATISFLSSCTVLSMTTYSVVNSGRSSRRTAGKMAIFLCFLNKLGSGKGRHSLYIIFFSQLTSIASSIIKGNIPPLSIALLVMMSIGGITGGMMGQHFNKTLEDKVIDKLFIGVMAVMIGINIYNIYIFF